MPAHRIAVIHQWCGTGSFAAALDAGFDGVEQSFCGRQSTLLVNAACSYLSIVLSPYCHGYGFAAGMLVATAVGLPLVNRQLERLNFWTFMHTR